MATFPQMYVFQRQKYFFQLNGDEQRNICGYSDITYLPAAGYSGQSKRLAVWFTPMTERWWFVRMRKYTLWHYVLMLAVTKSYMEPNTVALTTPSTLVHLCLDLVHVVQSENMNHCPQGVLYFLKSLIMWSLCRGTSVRLVCINKCFSK